MFHWAAVEAEMNRTLKALLETGLIESDIVSANMQVRDKIHVIRTIKALYCKTDVDLSKRLGKTLDRVVSLTRKRNVAAHNMFTETPSGGVSFFTVKAKGAWSNPDEVWPVEEFERLFKECEEVTEALGELADTVTERRAEVRSLLRKGPQRNALQGHARRLMTQAPASLDSDEPSPEADLPAEK